MQPKKCATRLVEIDGRLRPRSRYVATSSRGTQGTVLWCFAKRISLGPADLHPLKYHRYLSRGYRRQYRRRSDHLLAELRMETLNTPQRPAAAPPASHGPPGSPDRTAFQSIPISFASGARSSHQCTWNGATRMSFRLPVMTPGRWGEFPQSVMAIAAKARTATPAPPHSPSVPQSRYLTASENPHLQQQPAHQTHRRARSYPPPSQQQADRPRASGHCLD